MKVRCRPVDSVLAEVEGVQRHIAQRAHEISRARAGAIASALEVCGALIRGQRHSLVKNLLQIFPMVIGHYDSEKFIFRSSSLNRGFARRK